MNNRSRVRNFDKNYHERRIKWSSLCVPHVAWNLTAECPDLDRILMQFSSWSSTALACSHKDAHHWVMGFSRMRFFILTSTAGCLIMIPTRYWLWEHRLLDTIYHVSQVCEYIEDVRNAMVGADCSWKWTSFCTPFSMESIKRQSVLRSQCKH